MGKIRLDAHWGMYQGEHHQRTQHHESWEIELKSNTSEVLENKKTDSDPARVKYSVMERDGLFHVSVFLYNSYRRENTYPKQS